jgi:hypothetical protein
MHKTHRYYYGKMRMQSALYSRVQQALKKNDLEILISVEKRDPDLLKRVENFKREKLLEYESLEMSTDDILEQIKFNPLVRAHFRKDPTRQSIHENVQIELIKQFYPDAYKLPSAKKGTYLSDFKMKTDHPRPEDATKTLDIFVPSKNIYGVLKYSTTEGGAQDNQYNDVKKFIKEMIGYHTRNNGAPEKFVFYLDGPYYTEKRLKNLVELVPPEMMETSKIMIGSCDKMENDGIS